MRTRVTHILSVEYPVLSAGIPVIGVDLVASVSNAGGLGILGATYLSPAEIHARATAIRERTPRPNALAVDRVDDPCGVFVLQSLSSLESGTWARNNAELLEREQLDLGFRLVIAEY